MSPPWESYLYLATAAVGTAMSSLILHAINSSRARLLVSRLDRCVLLLVAVNCLWAAASLLRLVVAVAMDSTDMGGFGVFQLVVVYNCIGWSLLVNVCLALARYFTYTETPESMSRKYYLPLACLFIASTASVVVLGATAPPDAETDLLKIAPSAAFPLSSHIWGAIGSAIAISWILATCAIYACMFRQVHSRLKRSLPRSQTAVRMLLEKTHLKKCLRMGLTPMACLLPAIAVLFTCYATGKSQQDLPKWVHVLESECYIADAIFTPIVVMYFMKRIRLRVFDLVFPGKQRLLDAPSSSFEISSACEYSDDQELDIEFDQHFAEQSQNEEACGIISDTDTWRVAKP
ncbi:hypothetical protein HDU83_006795 [Entophlyctis luteolus]|nr:hypothetical protein HDU83_006795 [Entophlyctis luteolus]KAJ3379463.1 hypothetical protein HDU84_006638 [Entophlyctis sp. JEL0112]